MPAIKLEGFQGIVPRAAKTLLGNTQAQIADNVRLYGGELLPWRKPFFTYRPAGVDPINNPIVSIYRVTHDTDERWMTFHCDTDIVEGPVPNQDENRLYWTSACTAPRKSNWATLSPGAGPYPAGSFPMGIPNPVTAPTLAVSGTGTGTAVTRAYLYTWVNQFGTVEEESGPSNANTVNWQSGQTITVSGWDTPPAGPDYNWTKRRIYRTVVGTDPTQIIYLLVAEIPIAQASFVDNISDANIPGDVLSTTDFDPPPDDMRGLVILPNGILAGFVGNEVCFSEPYKPHAWPAKYRQALGYTIVGLAVYEQNLVAATLQCPYILTGIHPSTMTVTRVSLWEPCINKRSVAADRSGVVYASPNGLVGISALVQGVVTNALVRRQEWNDRFNPYDITAAIFDGQYFGFFTDTTGTSSSGGWAVVMDKSDDSSLAASTKTDVASYANAPPLTRMDYWASAVFVDKETATLFVCDKRTNWIYEIDGDPLDNMIAEWYSKRFVLPQPVNMSCIQVDADYEASDAPYFALVARYVLENTAWMQAHTADQIHGTVNSIQVNGGGTRSAIGNTMGTVNGSPMIWDVPSVFDFRSANIKVYADDNLVFTYNPTDLEPRRMLAGFKSRTWEVEISANFRVRSVAIATSMTELKQV